MNIDKLHYEKLKVLADNLKQKCTFKLKISKTKIILHINCKRAVYVSDIYELFVYGYGNGIIFNMLQAEIKYVFSIQYKEVEIVLNT